jgi:fluoroquinolone resistance protein
VIELLNSNIRFGLILYTKTDFQSLDLRLHPHFEECQFQGIDFSNYDLKSIAFLDCTFTSCNMANQPLHNASMRNIVFKGCKLMGVNWCSLKRLEDPQYYECKMDFSSFQSLKLKRAIFKNCSAVEVDFSEADLSLCDFSETNFAGANFDRANLSGADFRTSRDYFFDLRTAKIKGAQFSFPQVVNLITALGAKVEL